MSQESVFLPNPLSPKPEPPEGMEELTATIEEERKKELEEYRQTLTETKEEPLEPETEIKEESLVVAVQHDVDVAEAEAGKIKLPTMICIKTIRLDVDRFTAFYDKKFYKVKLDYDLYFEVNAKDEEECVKKILKFIQSQLKGMLDTTGDDMQITEFIPNVRKGETDTDYNFD